MIKENQHLFNSMLVVLDVLVVVLSLVLAMYIRFGTTLFGPIGGHLSYRLYSIFTIFVVIPVYLLCFYYFGLYKPFRNQNSIFHEATAIIKANIVSFILLVAFLFIIDEPNFSRILLFLLAFFGSIFGIIERALIRSILRLVRSNDHNLKHILLIGDNELAFSFLNKIKSKKYLGYSVRGILGREEHLGKEIEGVRFIGTFNDLEDILSKHNFDRVVIAIPLEYFPKLTELVDICENAGVKAEIIPDYYKYFPARPSVDMIDDMPVINIRYVPLDDAFNKFIKKVEDIIISLFAIVITSPIMLIVAIAIKLESPGPVIFKQERIGYKRKKFVMYKFRSMKVQDEDEEKNGWTTPDDKRKTRVGNFIRRTSIDELPQFFNVLKGDMSVIGPRPERPYFVDKFRKDIPKYMVKHQVRPGLTGLAQIKGYRGDTSIEKRIEYDIIYVEQWSFSLDVSIFIKTIFSFSDNAY